MRLSLHAKIDLLIAAVVAGLGVAIFAGLAILSNVQINAALSKDARETSGVLAALVAERSSALTDRCVLLARQPVIRALIGTGDRATISDSVRDYLPQLGANGALVSDVSGNVLGTAGDVPVTNSGYASGIIAAKQGTSWSGILVGRQHLMLAVSVPVFNGPDLWGTFTAFQNIDANTASQLKSVVGEDVAFLSNGQVVDASLHLPPNEFGGSRLSGIKAIGGAKYFVLFRPMNIEGSSSAGIVTLESYEDEVAGYRAFRLAALMLIAVALVLAIAGASVFSNSITKPLTSVIVAAREIQAGRWPNRFSAPPDDEVGLLQDVFNDMTISLRDSREKLEALIDTDLLTGLDNHRRFQERLAQEVRRSEANGECLTLLLCDIDHFKEFNKSYGLAVGDSALSDIARKLRESLPETAIVARYGGEEFAILLPGCDAMSAELLGKSVVSESVSSTNHNNGSVLTLSIGIAAFGESSSQPEGLILAAELALARAKQLGRNRVCRFESVPGADKTSDPYELHRFLQDGSLATIQALAAAVDAKDPYTRGHSANVARYAADLATHVGLSTDMIELVRVTGTLHDVGKIGVPDAILKKPDKLTDEEREIMETHPVLGEVIVRKAPQLEPTLPGVRHHHERWDGKGYPDKLAGNDIPLVARVLAVADSFDAMTSDRPYRKGLPFDYALSQIESGAGSQFDPELAVAFLELMHSEIVLAKAA